MIMDEEEYFQHHGVKGQKWGVIRERDTAGGESATASDKPKPNKPPTSETGSNGYGAGESKPSIKPPDAKEKASKAAYVEVVKSHKPPTSKAEQAANMVENEKKFAAKFGGDSSKKDAGQNSGKSSGKSDDHGWRPTNKQIAKVAIGVAVVGVVIYASKNQRALKAMLPAPGEECGPKQFKKACMISKAKTWSGGNYLKESSFLQEEMTFPKGHEFHRISMSAEKAFNGPTYSVPNIPCFNRYVTGFRGEKGSGVLFHHVTFKAKEEVKVPSLTKTLDTLHRVLTEDPDFPTPTREDTVRVYNKLSGGSWESHHARELFRHLGEDGYHGIVDHMDQGVIGDSPLVIFRGDSFTRRTSRAMSNLDIETAEAAVTELAARKL